MRRSRWVHDERRARRILVGALGIAVEASAQPATLALPTPVTTANPNAIEPAEPSREVKPRLTVPDSVAVEAHSTTYIPLFQRALLPGPAGSIPNPSLAIPVYEYLLLRVIDADTPWAKNSVDTELSLWGMGALVGRDDGRGSERRIDGDVSVAAVTHRIGLGYVKVGRQYVTEGASRFSHLDGVSAGYRSDWGLAVSGYAGFTVLPRWYAVPNYRLLGSASDAMVQRPEDFPHAQRSGNWMGGARIGYSQRQLGEVGMSIHEQRENAALGRRDLAFDLHVVGTETLDANARALLDLDSGQLADGFIGLGWHPIRRLDVAIDYRRMTPTLLMSKQSVLSVFAADRFDELGGEARYRVGHGLTVFFGSFVEWFEQGDYGARVRSGLRLTPDERHRLIINVAYSRVIEPENGYHGTRLSIGYRIFEPWMLTAEQYCYLYDHAIAGVATSTVHALNVAYRPTKAWELMLGSSLYNSPYAALDAQTMLRVSYTLGPTLGGEP
ncbi:MAG TPA: hypothetical protein VIV60_04315 [Polyangiaceae bacterium]